MVRPMTEASRIEFGKELRHLLVASGMTAAELSRLSGVTRAYLSRLLRGERRAPSIDTIRRICEFLPDGAYRRLTLAAGLPAEDFRERRLIESYVDQHRRLVTARYSIIALLGAGQTVFRTRLDRLFVAPTLNRLSKLSSTTVEFEEFVSSVKRTVVLGPPGSGKSVMCGALAVRFSTKQHTAIPVSLRDFAKWREQHGKSLADFISNVTASELQLLMPLDIVEEMLDTKNTVVLFDGLDEVVDVAARNEIVTIIEAFAARYANLRIVVFSRTAGYERAPLETFDLHELTPFSDEQIASYISRRIQATGAEDDGVTAEVFRRASMPLLGDLLGNPLTLNLAYSVFESQGHLPSDKFYLYQTLVEALMSGWDLVRGMEPSDGGVYYQQLLKFLAHWMHSSGHTTVSRAIALEKATRYLIDAGVQEGEAIQIAGNFLTHMRERSGLFCDVGVTIFGELQFGFVHRTVLEYLAALYITSVHPIPAAWADALAAKLREGAWTEVEIISAQILAHRLESGSEQIRACLEVLIAESGSPSERANVLEFVERWRDSMRFPLTVGSS